MAETASNEYQPGSSQTSQPRETHDESMMQQARQKAEDVKHEAAEMMRSRGDEGSTQAGEKVLSTAHDMRSVSDTLRERGQEGAAQAIDQAAFQTERHANYLRSSDTDTILHDAQEFARRQPWLVALGGLALGIVAARMVKAAGSASEDDIRARTDQQPSYESSYEPSYRSESSMYEVPEWASSPRRLAVVADEEGKTSGSSYESGTLGSETSSHLNEPSDLGEQDEDYHPGDTGTTGPRPF